MRIYVWPLFSLSLIPSAATRTQQARSLIVKYIYSNPNPMDRIRTNLMEYIWNHRCAPVSKPIQMTGPFMSIIFVYTYYSYPRLDIRWSRPSPTQYQYNHPIHHNHRRRNFNRLDNVRLLREPSTNVDQNHHHHHQQTHHNFRYISENQQSQDSHRDHSQSHRNHRKRHAHHNNRRTHTQTISAAETITDQQQ